MELTESKIKQLKDIAEKADNDKTLYGYDIAVEYIKQINPKTVISLLEDNKYLSEYITNYEEERYEYYKAFDKLAKKLGVFEKTDPGDPNTFEIFESVFDDIDNEADWLASELERIYSAMTTYTDIHSPTKEEWRKQAKFAVTNGDDETDG